MKPPEEYAEQAFAHAVYALCHRYGFSEVAECGGVPASALVCWSRGAMIPGPVTRCLFLRAVCS